MNLNRRNFIKIGGVSLSIGSLLALEAKAQPLFTNCDDFLSIYTKMDFTNDKEPVFPLLHPGRGEYDEIVFKETRNKDEVAYIEKRVLFIKPFSISGPTPDSLKEQTNQSALETLLAAAADRNMVVYDSKAKQQELSERLYWLMHTCMRRNAGGTSGCIFAKKPITDVFLRKSKLPEKKPGTAKWHGINNKVWDFVEDYYVNALGGSYWPNDSNLVIAVTTYNSGGGDFVYPILSHPMREVHGNYRQLMGMGVLDNTRVILGSY